MRVKRLTRFITAMILGMTSAAVYGTEASDSVTSSSDSSTRYFYRRGLLGKVYHYFQATNKMTLTEHPKFSFIGGPSYSKDTGFGIGILSAGLYSTCPADSLLPPSDISIVGQASTAGYYMAGVRGVHIYPHDTRRITYNVHVSSFDTYFWGIGFDSEFRNSSKTKYKLVNISSQADYTWKVAPKLYIGPAIAFDYSLARRPAKVRMWDQEPLSAADLGGGVTLKYDSRDNLNYPYSGELIEIRQLVHPDIFGSRSRFFMSTEFTFNLYRSVWKGGIIASHVHAEATLGHPLWNMLPQLGGSSGMRGYYEGRYRDRNEADFTIELRQHVVRRCGIAVWGGVGTVFSKPRYITFDRLLPNVGIGFRWEFKQRTNVRLDYGFGRRESGLVFQINEAF